MHEFRYTQTSLECYEAMRIAFGDEALRHFMLLSAFKYLWRHEHKGGVKDLDKALDYIYELEKFGCDGWVSPEKEQLLTLKKLILTHRLDAIERKKTSITNVPPSDNPYQE